MNFLCERQGYEKERSCFCKLLLIFEFGTTRKPGATFSQRWHQSFNQPIFDKLLPSCIGILYVISFPTTQQDADIQK